jgi:hypothetical protein
MCFLATFERIVRVLTDPLSWEASLYRFFSGSPANASVEAPFSAEGLLSDLSAALSFFDSSLSSWSLLLFFFGLNIFSVVTFAICSDSASGSSSEGTSSSSSTLESRDLFLL